MQYLRLSLAGRKDQGHTSRQRDVQPAATKRSNIFTSLVHVLSISLFYFDSDSFVYISFGDEFLY